MQSIKVDSALGRLLRGCLPALIGASTLTAQSTAVKGASIIGSVTDPSRVPVAGASVEVVGLATVRTDSAGAFRVDRLPLGTLIVRVTRLGFTPALKLLSIQTAEEIRLTIMLSPTAQRLDSVVVRADSASRALDDPTGFDRRRHARNGGIFVVSEDIERRHPIDTEQLFRGMPGVQVDTAGLLSVDRGKVSLRDFYLPAKDNDQFHTCIGMQVFIDGVAMPQPFNINDVAPDRIRAIEVYQGPATTPSELRSPKSVCGTVAIWTKSG